MAIGINQNLRQNHSIRSVFTKHPDLLLLRTETNQPSFSKEIVYIFTKKNNSMREHAD